MSEQQKLALFEQAERVYGRPALMLSGEGSLWYLSFRSNKSLMGSTVITPFAGSSMGAVVARRCAIAVMPSWISFIVNN